MKIDSFDLANTLDGQALEQMGKSEPRSRHNQVLSPHEYRSRLFSALFQDETNRHGIDDYLDDVVEFEIEGTKRFIHLIYGIGNAGKAEVFKNAITELCAKP